MSDSGPSQVALAVGDRLTLDIERVAHGGHFIAYSDGVTLFVRGAITGERVVAEVIHRKKRIALAEVVEVVTPSPHRVVPPCSYYVERVCGGCDFQHIDLAYQRQLKAEVVEDSFKRIAGMIVTVACLPPLDDETDPGSGNEGAKPGFHWRNRMDFTLTPANRLALHPHRSDALTEVTSCLIADEALAIESINTEIEESDLRSKVSAWDRIRVGIAGSGEIKFSPRDTKITMEVIGKRFPISVQSFWQPHRLAAKTLVSRMQALLEVKPGEVLLDLYGGVGLFTAFLRDEVGESGSVTLIESDTSAVNDARRIFKDDPRVRILSEKVEVAIKTIDHADRIVLDPPRTGVAPGVIADLARLRPRQILYISCDPATLARDAKALVEAGYEMASIEAYDLFPMTEHIESVANFILKA